MIPSLKEPVHKGHRERMRAKLEAHGTRVFDTYELLEMALYYAIPQRDTNPVAKRLLAAFGSLDGVFRAKREELVSVEGVGESVADFLITLGRFTEELESREDELPIFSDYSETGKYLVRLFEGTEGYSVRFLLFNSKLDLISVHEMGALDLSSGGIKPTPFINLAIEAGASIAMIAHSHPYGPLFPSEGDMQSSHLLSASLDSVGVVLLEGYVISGERYFGYIQNIRRAFAKLGGTTCGNAVLNFIKTKEAAMNEQGV